MSRRSLFHEIASLVTARQIEDPIGSVVPIDATTGSATLYEGAVSVVVDGVEPVGWISSDDVDQAEMNRHPSIWADVLHALPANGDCDQSPGATTEPAEDRHPGVASSLAFIANGEHPATSESLFDDIEAHIDGMVPIPIREIMHPLEASSIISPATTYLDCVERFSTAENLTLLVRDGTGNSGVIEYRDLFKPAGRICLLALTQELEAAAIDLICSFGDKCLAALREQHEQAQAIGGGNSRWQKMRSMFNERYIRNHKDFSVHWSSGLDREILRDTGLLWHFLAASTTFTDKFYIIAKCKLLSAPSWNHVKGVFKRAERVRNNSAHPTGLEDAKDLLVPGPEIERNKFGTFFRECRELIDTLALHTPGISVFSPRHYEQCADSRTEAPELSRGDEPRFVEFSDRPVGTVADCPNGMAIRRERTCQLGARGDDVGRCGGSRPAVRMCRQDGMMYADAASQFPQGWITVLKQVRNENSGT